MYGLALGIARVNESLPVPVYALISGLNAATVGIIALAAVQLAQKAITDKLSRILVFLGGTAGMLYNALWYFPVLMVAAGIVTVAWDAWKEGWWRRRDLENAAAEGDGEMREVSAALPPGSSRASQRSADAGSLRRVGTPIDTSQHPSEQDSGQSPATPAAAAAPITSTAPPATLIFNWKFGLSVICFFFVTFIPIMTLRALLRSKNAQPFKLFANFYLAGTWQTSPPFFLPRGKYLRPIDGSIHYQELLSLAVDLSSFLFLESKSALAV
jgi:hypothetical protein